MKRIADYAVVYDLSADAERTKVDKILKGFGFRVQKSVFECRLDKKGKNNLITKLESLNLKTGFVKIYRLEYSSQNNIIGLRKKTDLNDGHAFII